MTPLGHTRTKPDCINNNSAGINVAYLPPSRYTIARDRTASQRNESIGNSTKCHDISSPHIFEQFLSQCVELENSKTGTELRKWGILQCKCKWQSRNLHETIAEQILTMLTKSRALHKKTHSSNSTSLRAKISYVCRAYPWTWLL